MSLSAFPSPLLLPLDCNVKLFFALFSMKPRKCFWLIPRMNNLTLSPEFTNSSTVCFCRVSSFSNFNISRYNFLEMRLNSLLFSFNSSKALFCPYNRAHFDFNLTWPCSLEIIKL